MFRCLFLTLSLTFFFDVHVISLQQVADSAEMIKTITGIPNVTLIPNNATTLGLFGTGESYTHFYMAVPEEGFKYYVETTLTGSPAGDPKWPTPSNDTSKCFESKIVHPDGLVTGYPRDNDDYTFHFPPLNTLPTFGNGKRILKLRLSWRNMTLPFFLKLPWSVRILTPEPISTTPTTEMPTTIEHTEDSLTTTSNNPFFRDKWWLIVNIGTTFVVVSSVLSAFLIYKSFRLRTSSNSDNVSTTMVPQTSEVSNANSVAITSEDPENRPSAMPES